MNLLKGLVAPSKGIKTLREMVVSIEETLIHHPAMINTAESPYPKLTYGQVKDIIAELGTALINIGVKKGERIGLLSENRSEWAIAYLSVVSIGAVIVPLDILLSSNELIPLVQDSGLILLFTSSGQKTKADQIIPAIAGLKNIVIFDRVDETKDNIEKKEAQNLIDRLLSLSIIPSLIKDYFNKNKKKFVVSDNNNILLKDQCYIDFGALIHGGFQLMESGNNTFDCVTVEPEDTAAIIYTSGTTGNPKGVMLSHYNLSMDADEIQMIDKMSHNDKWVILLPMHHTFPTIGFLVPFLVRATVTFVATLRTDVILSAFKESRVTAIPIVPLFLEKVYKNIFKTVKERGRIFYIIFKALFYFSRLCLKITGINIGKLLFHSVREKLGLTHLKYFISGGGPIAREIQKGFYVMGIFVAQGYGLTETSPTVSCNSLFLNRFGSVGKPLRSVQVKIDQPDNKGNGEILIKAPYVMKGYYRQPDKTGEVIDSNGWFHTGDIGRLDRDSYLWITGRMKNIIVTSGGKNIYPEELENLLLQSNYISEAVVIGNRDWDSNSEVPYAIIYPNFESFEEMEKQKGKKLDEDEIYFFIGNEIKKATQDIAVYKKIAGFEIINEELPKTSSKKVKRYLFKK